MGTPNDSSASKDRRAPGSDLRVWLEEVERRGQLQKVRGASVDYEIGAVTDLNAKARGPALLFVDIPGFESVGSVLSCSLGSAVRLSLALGLDPENDDHTIVRELVGKPATWLAAAGDFPPTIVSSGPVLKRVLGPGEFDMSTYPAPLWHEGDGGYYLGTGCCVITRDPADGAINVGTYRVAVHGPTRLGVFIEPIHHGAIHLQKHHERGEACPIAISFGQAPILHLASSMPMPYGVSELDYAGAMSGSPLEVVMGEVTGLPIPAHSELAIEGWIDPGDEEVEGPFGEFTGYFAGGRHPRPSVRVERVYQRADPIVYGSLPSRPPFDHSYWRAVIESSMLLDRLGASGVPDVRSVWKHEAGSANFWTVVSIRQRYAGHARQAGLIAAMASEGASMGRYVIVVDEDVDARDLEQVIWAMSTRTDPSESIQVIDRTPTNPLDPMLLDLDGPWWKSRAIVDACRPFHRRRDFAKVVEVSPELASRVRARWGGQLEL